MTPELSKHQPEEILDRIEKLDELAEKGSDWLKAMLDDVAKVELDQLQRVFTRFCLKKAKMVDMSKVSERNFKPVRPNYSEYYYNEGTPDEYLLMTRELVNDNGKISLNINFNPELAFNNEL